MTSHLMVSGMVDEYARINATVIAKKSPSQLKRWRVHRDSAIAVFIGGDRPLRELRTERTHKFRPHWQQRALNNEVEISSANRADARCRRFLQLDPQISPARLQKALFKNSMSPVAARESAWPTNRPSSKTDFRSRACLQIAIPKLDGSST